MSDDFAETFNVTADHTVIVAASGGRAQLRIIGWHPVEIDGPLLAMLASHNARCRHDEEQVMLFECGALRIEARRLGGLVELMDRARRAAER